MPRVVVTEYQAEWPQMFERLRERIWPHVADLAVGMEHVGSTSVPGLAAKPVIDCDIVVARTDDVSEAIKRLERLGYEHISDLGIAGREAFRAPADQVAHNLYVCPAGCVPLRNHLAVRDYLRQSPEAVAEYADLKRRLAAEHPDDIDAYIEGKSAFILSILARADFTSAELVDIERRNRKPTF